MRFEPDNNSMGQSLFDELAGFRPDDGGESPTLAEVREAAGLFDGAKENLKMQNKCQQKMQHSQQLMQ